MSGPATWWNGARWRVWNWMATQRRWDDFRWGGRIEEILRGLQGDTVVLVRASNWDQESDFLLWREHDWGVSLVEAGLLSSLPLDDGIVLEARASGRDADVAITRLQLLLGRNLTEADRLRGAIWGMAIGEALGVPAAGREPTYLLEYPVTGMEFGGMHGQPPGTWGKATSSLLVMIDSFAAGYRPRDFVLRLYRWHRYGERTARGEAFDVDAEILRAFERMILEPWNCNWSCIAEDASPLGRSLAACLMLRDRPDDEIANQALLACGATHRSLRARLACAWYALIARGLLDGADIRSVLRRAGRDLHRRSHGLDRAGFERLFDLSVCDLPRDALGAGGSVIQFLEAAIWCLARHPTFQGAVLEAVNFGDEADTLGALVGGLAGIREGDWGIPEAWPSTLLGGDHLVDAVIMVVSRPAYAPVPP